MEQLISYALKVIACSGAFYLLYRLLLESRTEFLFCRIYILCSLIAAALIPALRFEVFPGQVVEIPFEVVAMLGSATAGPDSAVAVNPPSSGAIPVLLLLYCLISFCFACALFSQFIHIRRLKACSRRSTQGKILIYESDRIKSPFTFFRCVFVPAGLVGMEREQVLTHEASHARCNHSAELLAVELLKVFIWFDPFLWLGRKALVEVHEYEADNAVIEKGHDVCDYKNLIFRQLFGYSPDISNGLAASKTKKRLIMMDKKKPGRRSMVRAVAVIPVVGTLVTLFSFTTRETVYIIAEAAVGQAPAVEREAHPVAAARQPDHSASVPSAEPEYPDRLPASNDPDSEGSAQEWVDKYWQDKGTTPEEYAREMVDKYWQDKGTTPEEFAKEMAEKFWRDKGTTPEEFAKEMAEKYWRDKGTTPEEFAKEMAEKFGSGNGNAQWQWDSTNWPKFNDLPEQWKEGLENIRPNAEGLSRSVELRGWISPDSSASVTIRSNIRTIGSDRAEKGESDIDIDSLKIVIKENRKVLEEYHVLLDSMRIQLRIGEVPDIDLESMRRQIEALGESLNGIMDKIEISGDNVKLKTEGSTRGETTVEKVRISSRADKIAVYIDGNETDENISELDPANFESISVVKDRETLSRYGKADYDGIIFITTSGGGSE